MLGIEAIPGLKKIAPAGIALGVLGLVGLGVGQTLGANVWGSYLLGFMFWLSLSLGCIGVMLLHNMTKGAWGYNIIRAAESGAAMLPIFLVGLAPIAFLGLESLYPWADSAMLESTSVLRHKVAYLGQPWFTVKSLVYFAIWLTITFTLIRWSRQEDDTGDATLINRRANFAAPMTVLFVLTMTFSITDWVMSLEVYWFSTMLGFMFTAGSALTAFAFLTFYLTQVYRRRPFEVRIYDKQWRDLGNWMFTLTCFWAYVTFSQFLITWAANLPEESPYFIQRSIGPWLPVGTTLVFLAFMLPFLLLLSSRLKRTPTMLGGVAVWIVLLRMVDMVWTVLPSLHRSGVQIVWMDFAGLLAFGGLWVGFWALRMQNIRVVPRYSPLSQEVHENVA